MIAFVQSKSMALATLSATPFTTSALSSGTTAGNTVIICVEASTDNPITGITGGSGTFASRQAYANAMGTVEIWEGTGVTAGTTQFVVAYSGGGTIHAAVQILEFSGVQGFDLGLGSATPITTASAVVPTITPTGAGDLFIAVGNWNTTTNSAVATNSYTDVGTTGLGMDAAWYIATDDLSHSTAWALTASSPWLSCGASFLQAPPPPLARPSVTAVLNGDTVDITVDSSVTVPGGSTLTATVIRSDGTYVLDASPTFPAVVSGGTVSVQDNFGAYGATYSYVANLTLTTPPDTLAYSPPSIPSSPLTLPLGPDQLALYGRLGWAQTEDTTGELLKWLTGIASMPQRLDSLCTDGYDLNGDPAPGWSQVLDITRAPTAVLPWLGQFLGVTLDPTLRDDQQRYRIENPTGFARGTPAAILAAINQYLAPGFTATLFERDTSAYHLTISVPTGGIASQITCLELSQEYGTCAALITHFANCRLLWKSAATAGGSGASSCYSLWQNIATCADLYAVYATCADVWATDRNIDNAIAASVPAGLVAQIVYA